MQEEDKKEKVLTVRIYRIKQYADGYLFMFSTFYMYEKANSEVFGCFDKHVTQIYVNKIQYQQTNQPKCG